MRLNFSIKSSRSAGAVSNANNNVEVPLEIDIALFASPSISVVLKPLKTLISYACCGSSCSRELSPITEKATHYQFQN